MEWSRICKDNKSAMLWMCFVVGLIHPVPKACDSIENPSKQSGANSGAATQARVLAGSSTILELKKA
jgi:hypothetical protein